MAESRGLEPAGQLQLVAADLFVRDAVAHLGSKAAARYRSSLLMSVAGNGLEEESLRKFLIRLDEPAIGRLAAADLGRVYEQLLGASASARRRGFITRRMPSSPPS